jgi:O-antigen ligase
VGGSGTTGRPGSNRQFQQSWSTAVAVAISVLCLIVNLVCVPLTVLKPKWVFYAFLVSTTFGRIFYGYVSAAGNLGAPRAWQPADGLALLTIVAAFFEPPRDRRFAADLLEKGLIVMALISIFATVQGLTLQFIGGAQYAAVGYSRVTHFAAAIFFGLRYFTSRSRVDAFIKFTVVMIVAIFVLHLMIRVNLFTPPTAEIEYETQLGGARGGRTVVLMLYLPLVALAIARITNRVGWAIVSAILLLMGVGGIMLSETRSMYGALGLLILASLFFVKGRAKSMLVFGIVGLCAIAVAAQAGFDFLDRFRIRSGSDAFDVTATFQERTWRGYEYRAVVQAFAGEPYFFLTGRGTGALHPVPFREMGMAAAYHNDYLGWLDRCGLVGFGALLVVCVTCIWRCYRLTQGPYPYMRYVGTIAFLSLVALAGQAVFFPVFSHQNGSSMLICFPVIIANWRRIQEGLAVEAAGWPGGQMAQEARPWTPESGGVPRPWS